MLHWLPRVRVHFSNVAKSVISPDTVISHDKITLKWQCQVKLHSSWQEENGPFYFNRLQVIFLSVNYPVRQETVVAYTNVTLNHDIGVLVGNFCGPAVVNISGNYFTYGRYIGLEVLSCWRDTNLEGVAPGDMMLQIGHNHFMHNEAVATRCDQWTVLLSCSNIYLPIFSKGKNRLSWTFFCRVGPEL